MTGASKLRTVYFMDAAAAVDEHCRRHRYRVGDPLQGGRASHVITVEAPSGERLVVKAPAPRSEREWLARHPCAPAIHPDSTDGVLVLERLDAEPLRSLPYTSLDWGRELSWLKVASAANGPLTGDELPVVTPHMGLLGQMPPGFVDAAPLDMGVVAAYYDWLGSEPFPVRSVAIDVISKNTLQDASGAWWVIDPYCVRGPDELTWCHWAVDRSAHHASPHTRIEIMNWFVSCSSDPWQALLVLPAACLWRLWWYGVNQNLDRFIGAAHDTSSALSAWQHLIDAREHL